MLYESIPYIEPQHQPPACIPNIGKPAGTTENKIFLKTVGVPLISNSIISGLFRFQQSRSLQNEIFYTAWKFHSLQKLEYYGTTNSTSFERSDSALVDNVSSSVIISVQYTVKSLNRREHSSNVREISKTSQVKYTWCDDEMGTVKTLKAFGRVAQIICVATWNVPKNWVIDKNL